jgi:hypothetical protein
MHLAGSDGDSDSEQETTGSKRHHKNSSSQITSKVKEVHHQAKVKQ